MIPSARVLFVPGPSVDEHTVVRALRAAPAEYDVGQASPGEVGREADCVVLAEPLKRPRAIETLRHARKADHAVVAITRDAGPRERREALERGVDELCDHATIGEGGLHYAVQAAVVRRRMARRFRQHLKRQEQLLRLSGDLSRAARLDEVHECLMLHADGYVGAAGGGLWVVSEDDRWLRLTHVAGAQESSKQAAQRLPLSAPTLAAAALRARRTLVVPSRQQLLAEHPMLVKLEPTTHAAMATPLCDSTGRVSAIIGLRFDAELDDDHVGYLELFAKLGADAAYRAALYEELHERSAFEKRLLGVVGHDLRTPLNTLGIGLDLVEATKELSPATLARLRRAASQIRTVAGDLFDLAHVRGGGLTLELRPVPLGEVARSVAHDLRLQYPDRTITVEVEDPKLKILGDAARIAQALANLTINAVKYGDETREVRIVVDRTEGSPTIRVRNWGKVIDASRLQELFEPFTRDSHRHLPSSLGLGLYVVREIARAHGGTVAAVSSESAGTAFTLRFPNLDG